MENEGGGRVCVHVQPEKFILYPRGGTHHCPIVDTKQFSINFMVTFNN